MGKIVNYIAGQDIYESKYYSAAMDLRKIALLVDQEPDNILNYINYPIIDELLNDQDSTCFERTKVFESLSYGDPGVLLACPGTSLAGLMVRELGNSDQKTYFFNEIKRRRARTCLAVTEPFRGSDASNMQASLTLDHHKKQYYINGEKWLVGNGAVAELGVVVVRRNKGPLGICAVLLTPEVLHASELERLRLPLVGLRGTQLSYLNFKNCLINEEHILGKELNAVNRGMMAVIKTFNRMRPCVAGLAIGLSQAVLDYLVAHVDTFNQSATEIINKLYAELNIARNLLYSSAQLVDKDPLQSAPPSLAKVEATRLAEKIVNAISCVLPPGGFMEHPLLFKWYRDAFGFEYMEGTENMQRKNVLQPHLAGNKYTYSLDELLR